MKHSHTYQHFALNTDNCIVDIKDVYYSNERYFCPYCHSEMIAKRGNIRQWHFAHKADKCSYDKYLHSIAEIMIMNWFNQKEHIILSMDSYEKVSIRPRACFSPSYNKVKSQTKHVWLLTLL